MRVAELMSWELLLAWELDDASSTLKRMRARGIRQVPVVLGPRR